MGNHEDDDTTIVGIDPVKIDAPRDRPYLIVIAGTHAGEMIRLGMLTVIGRGIETDIRLLEDRMSRRHCQITIEDTGTFLEDLGSSNGTFVNGVRVERHPLVDGDKIQIGETTILKFTYNDSLEEKFQTQMYNSALRDGLTQLFNKQYFTDRIQPELAFALRHSAPLSLILFDIDRFKAINDTFGHLAGDKVLATIGQHLLRLVRTEDVVARYGGEEFAVLCRDTDARNARVLAERLRRAIEQLAIVHNGRRLAITISVGVAAVPGLDITQAEQLIAAADAALYEAKRAGRNRVVVPQVID
jgi:diguanylate cyclase (GGDEF)-like protein